MSKEEKKPIEGEVLNTPKKEGENLDAHPENAEPATTELVAAPPEAQTVLDLYTPKQIDLIKRTVAKGTTNDELAMFLHISKKASLDPFLKEIWCYKDGKDNTIIFAGRDGFKRVAESSGFFGGVKSGAVHENDEFSIDLFTGEVSHKIIAPAARGKLVGAWAIARRTDRKEPAVEYVENVTYNKGYNTWKTHPDEMLRKVAEVHVLKTLFIINGVYSEEERDSIIERSEAGLLEAPDEPTGAPASTEWQDKLGAKLMSMSNGEATPQDVWHSKTQDEYPSTEADAKRAFAQLLKQTNANNDGQN